MPTPEQKQELSARYLKELLKVGFDQAQAETIVAEAADRLGTDIDRPKQYIPLPAQATPEQARASRAVRVIERKERQPLPARMTWNVLKHQRRSSAPGDRRKLFMDVMQEQLTSEMKRLEFTQDDIDFILGTD